jgi:hypothetical protein
MLVTSSFQSLRTIAITTVAFLLFFTYYACDSENRTCGSFRTRGSASHHSSSHGHACIRSDALVLLESGLSDIKYIVPGDKVLIEDNTFVEVSDVSCHDGNFSMWKMPDLPPITTSNHPVKLNGTWFAGDPVSALHDFDINVMTLGAPSPTIVKNVCSVETIKNVTVAFVVFFDGYSILAAD